MRKTKPLRDFECHIDKLQDNFNRIIQQEQDHFQNVAKMSIRKEEMKFRRRNGHCLELTNDYPSYGAYQYSGSIPHDTCIIEPSKQIMSSDVWKTHPLVLPSKLPMFEALMKTGDNR